MATALQNTLFVFMEPMYTGNPCHGHSIVRNSETIKLVNYYRTLQSEAIFLKIKLISVTVNVTPSVLFVVFYGPELSTCPHRFHGCKYQTREYTRRQLVFIIYLTSLVLSSS